MAALFDGIPLDKVSTSMTINATAIILLALYVAVGKRQGVAPKALSGTVQNDILKEYIARGTYIYPPQASLRIVTDIFAFCEREVPQWNTISISGYHIREAGSTAVQEVAFTFANAIAYVQAAATGRARRQLARPAAVVLLQRAQRLPRGGREVPRRAAAVGAHHEASASAPPIRARSSCASTPRRPAARSPRSSPTTTSSASRSRRWRRCMGGTQSLHTNGRDEALALPTEDAARIALRTQQIIGHESGVANTIDPFAGSYHIEQLTNEIEAGARELLARIEAVGGTLAAIEAGYIQRQVQESAYRAQLAVDAGEAVVVGVNKYRDRRAVDASRCSRSIRSSSAQQVRARADRCAPARDQATWQAALDAVARRPHGARQPRAARSSPPSRRRPRSARSPIRCARVFGEYREVEP